MKIQRKTGLVLQTKGYLLSLLVLLLPAILKAQLQVGDIFINAGVGYSPGFDGGFIGAFSVYPAPTSDSNKNGFPHAFRPAMGLTVDYMVNDRTSIGIAGTYESVQMNWSLISGQGLYFLADRIARLNVAGRILRHFSRNPERSDNYLGIRVGDSYWKDVPVSTGSFPPGIPLLNPIPLFLTHSTLNLLSFQVLYGSRIFLPGALHNFGFNFEIAIGSPYMAEAGISYRILKGNTSRTR